MAAQYNVLMQYNSTSQHMITCLLHEIKKKKKIKSSISPSFPLYPIVQMYPLVKWACLYNPAICHDSVRRGEGEDLATEVYSFQLVVPETTSTNF